jgi:Flp pilus assembly protein TadD/ferredoxin
MNDGQVQSTSDSRCTGGGVPLPVLASGQSPKIRPSRMGKWRAGSLILIHLIMIAHALHFLQSGETLSPIEPSEAMYTLELGYLNAGAIFFGLSLLATLVFGRFFCGWGCHLIAYQDLCGWIMKKLGVRPKPFRSRLLVYVPIALAFYMFIWPTAVRILMPSPERAFPGLTNQLVTNEFWKTFAGPLFGGLTILACGFAAVYFLGAKGFCTYGCPYGGFYGLVDRVATGKILVNDDCEQCGHCTASCTSNVRVHEEVKLYGMVVDPGCMKCMDCVSVCPNDALRWGFARPSVAKRRPAEKRPKRSYDFTWTEELVLVVLFLGATGSFRGLYDGPPLLMAVALGGITAFLALKLWRLIRQPTVRVQNLKVKVAGKIRPIGWAFAITTALWMVFTIHSGFVQWHRAWGRHYKAEGDKLGRLLAAAGSSDQVEADRRKELSKKSFDHFQICDAWDLVDTVEVKAGVASYYFVHGDDATAESHLREALKIAPNHAPLHMALTELLYDQGRIPEAIDALQTAMSLTEPTAANHFRLANMLSSVDRKSEAMTEYEACLAIDPDWEPAQFMLGGMLAREGRFTEAIDHLLEADRLKPDDADTKIELGLAYFYAGRIDDAIASLEQAIKLAPSDPQPRMHLDIILQSTGRRRSPVETTPQKP